CGNSRSRNIFVADDISPGWLAERWPGFASPTTVGMDRPRPVAWRCSHEVVFARVLTLGRAGSWASDRRGGFVLPDRLSVGHSRAFWGNRAFRGRRAYTHRLQRGALNPHVEIDDAVVIDVDLA